MEEQLQQSILKTLAYFDIFDHPLTKEELFRYLISGYPNNSDLRISYLDFIKQLDSLPGVSASWRRSQGFYFLAGREDIVDKRQLKVKLVEEKMKIAICGIKKIAKIPFVRAVFVCNTLAMGFPDEESDIDLFIIVRKGRLWLSRFLVTLILSVFRLRRTKIRINNRICLSFYVTDDNLDLEKIAIKDDVYLLYWLNNLIPIYDPGALHQSVLDANKWVYNYLLNGLQPYQASIKQKAESRKLGQMIKSFFEKAWGERYGDLLEKQAKEIQRAKMKRNLQSVQNESGTRVVVSDSMLKFHENDRREEYKEKWEKRCGELMIF